MNDAQSQRHDAAGGSDPGPRPDDPYPSDSYPPPSFYGDEGSSDDTSPYAGGVYPGDDPQRLTPPPHEPYGYGPYMGRDSEESLLPPQQAYEGEYYSADRYSADPDRPGGDGTDSYHESGYDAAAPYPTNWSKVGQYHSSGAYGAGPHRQTGPYQTGPYQTGQDLSGEDHAAGWGPAPYNGAASYPSGLVDGDVGPPTPPPGPSGYAEPDAPVDPAVGQPPPSAPGYAPPPVDDNPYAELGELEQLQDESGAGQGQRRPEDPLPPDHGAERFAFVDDEDSEEVIDWLKFAETRTERRDERKRRGRNRRIALTVVLVLGMLGGTGYLWQQDRLPFLGEENASAPTAAQRRDVIVVHLRELDTDNSSTALLVSNETIDKGAAVLLPNALAVSTDDASSTTLGKSLDDAGAGPTRDGLSTLLGADIKGTWRLDTPFLELLVESVGGILLDTDAEVRGTGKDRKKTLVNKGENQRLGGVGAVAYATYRAPGEAGEGQLARFGQVMQAVLKKIPPGTGGARGTVRNLGLVPDPSLPEDELAASLAALAQQAKAGRFQTLTLSVRPDGSLGERSTKGVVKEVLGGVVNNTNTDATPSVRVQDATGRPRAVGDAQVALVNSGYTFVSGGKVETAVDRSRVEYPAAADAQLAREVAQTLGLPKGAVRKVKDSPQNARVSVVLGRDFAG